MRQHGGGQLFGEPGVGLDASPAASAWNDLSAQRTATRTNIDEGTASPQTATQRASEVVHIIAARLHAQVTVRLVIAPGRG